MSSRRIQQIRIAYYSIVLYAVNCVQLHRQMEGGVLEKCSRDVGDENLGSGRVDESLHGCTARVSR